MARVEISGIAGVMRSIRDQADRIVQNVQADVETTARAKTPIKTGNARKNWASKKDKTGFDVENRVPYIERLEGGSSKQAPRGIIGPTLKDINRRNK